MTAAAKGKKGDNGTTAGMSAKASTTKPQTGSEYLESLRDDRTVFIYGERVKDVTTHPAFRNTARMVARLYDALHDPKHKDKIMVPTDTGNGGNTHAFFKAPKTMDDLLAGRNAIAEWARLLRPGGRLAVIDSQFDPTVLLNPDGIAGAWRSLLLKPTGFPMKVRGKFLEVGSRLSRAET